MVAPTRVMLSKTHVQGGRLLQERRTAEGCDTRVSDIEEAEASRRVPEIATEFFLRGMNDRRANIGSSAIVTICSGAGNAVLS